MRKGDDSKEEFIFLDGLDDEITTDQDKSSLETDDSDHHDKSSNETLVVESIASISEIQSSADISDEPFVAEIVSDGIHHFTWPIRGMDCPDCSLKATNAVKKNSAVISCKISPTDGIVNLEIDLGDGDLSDINQILKSIGYEPDLNWMKLDGVNLDSVMERQKCEKKSLLRLMKSGFGILDVKFSGQQILVQTPPTLLPSSRREQELALERMTGKSLNLIKSESPSLSISDQRLICASIALLVLPIIMFLDIIAAPTLFITTFGLVGTLVGGFRMFQEAISSIRNRILGFQVLTSLAVIGASILQKWPEALMVVLLESISGHLESSALVRARDAMQGGLDRLPHFARVVPSNKPKIEAISSSTFSVGLSPISSLTPSRPQPKEVPIDLVNLGDLVEVRSGELIPVDGLIFEGAGQIDRAPMTGESVPVRISVGDFVEAGLVLIRGPILIEVSAVGSDTKLSGLIEKVHTYRDQPPRFQSSIEVFTKYWVPIVLVGGALMALLSGEIITMLLLWIVACPCSLLLAAPVPHATALSTAAHFGIIARGGDVLERTARVDLVLLDKTGTLTSGHPSLDSIVLAEDIEISEVLGISAGLEQRSNHPYASTILFAASNQEITPFEIKSISDEVAGVSGKIGRSIVRLGSEEWLLDEGISIPKSLSDAATKAREKGFGISILSKSKTALGLFIFNNDDLRDGAKNLIIDLKEMGVSIELLSGDSQPAVISMGEKLGINSMYCHGDIDPDGKAIWVKRRSQAMCTIMAGDGFNDAAALASADVGIAVGTGESVNLEAADVLIPSNNPGVLSNLLRLSKKTRKIVQINLLISFLVTFILVISVIDKWHESLVLGVLVHEVTVLIIILNGLWVSDGGVNRLKVLGSLFKQLADDSIQAWKSLMLVMNTNK